MLLTACGTTKKSQREEQKVVNIEFSADSAYAFCAAQCQYGPRTMNSDAHERCGQWIAEKFRQYGCDVELQKAALKGYDDAISEKQSIYEPRMELGNEQRDALDARLLSLHERLRAGERPCVTILCFIPREDGVVSSPPLGQYRSFSGIAEKMNLEDQRLRLDGRWFPLGDIMEMEEKDPLDRADFPQETRKYSPGG